MQPIDDRTAESVRTQDTKPNTPRRQFMFSYRNRAARETEPNKLSKSSRRSRALASKLIEKAARSLTSQRRDQNNAQISCTADCRKFRADQEHAESFNKQCTRFANELPESEQAERQASEQQLQQRALQKQRRSNTKLRLELFETGNLGTKHNRAHKAIKLEGYKHKQAQESCKDFEFEECERAKRAARH